MQPNLMKGRKWRSVSSRSVNRTCKSTLIIKTLVLGLLRQVKTSWTSRTTEIYPGATDQRYSL